MLNPDSGSASSTAASGNCPGVSENVMAQLAAWWSLLLAASAGVAVPFGAGGCGGDGASSTRQPN